jgi:Tfp pilus assembly protein PilO
MVLVLSPWCMDFFSSQPTAKIEELVKEEEGVKVKLEQWQKQPAALSKLTRQLSLRDS